MGVWPVCAESWIWEVKWWLRVQICCYVNCTWYCLIQCFCASVTQNKSRSNWRLKREEFIWEVLWKATSHRKCWEKSQVRLFEVTLTNYICVVWTERKPWMHPMLKKMLFFQQVCRKGKVQKSIIFSKKSLGSGNILFLDSRGMVDQIFYRELQIELRTVAWPTNFGKTFSTILPEKPATLFVTWPFHHQTLLLLVYNILFLDSQGIVDQIFYHGCSKLNWGLLPDPINFGKPFRQYSLKKRQHSLFHGNSWFSWDIVIKFTWHFHHQFE